MRHWQRNDGIATEGQRRDLDVLHRTEYQIVRLTRLLDDLVDTSRIRAGRLELRLEASDLIVIVRAAVEAQRVTNPDRLILLPSPHPTAISLYADADRIGQVVINYLTNALKYSDEDQPVQVRVEVTDTHARVSVTDHGPGIPTTHLEQIWDVFHRVPGIAVRSGSGVGLGLGLHICQMIIEHHGGQVGVTSSPGQGSTFWFTLPLSG